MRRQIVDEIFCESMLYGYFSPEVGKKMFAPKVMEKMEKFYQYCIAYDNFYLTDTAGLLKRIYSNRKIARKNLLVEELNMSEASIYRFRSKMLGRMMPFMNLDI